MIATTPIHRRTVLPALASALRARTYLEIGVKKGRTFLSIPVRTKYAVDPSFRVRVGSRIKYGLLYPPNLMNRYFEMTSDEFFGQVAPRLFAHRRLDLAFIDGLHTHEQSLRDVEHCLPHLSRRGLIVVHDCSPPHATAAHPADSLEHARQLKLPGWDGRWCGDVWKTAVELRIRPDLDFMSVDADSGIGFVTRRVNGAPLTRDFGSTAALSFEWFEAHKSEILRPCKAQETGPLVRGILDWLEGGAAPVALP